MSGVSVMPPAFAARTIVTRGTLCDSMATISSPLGSTLLMYGADLSEWVEVLACAVLWASVHAMRIEAILQFIEASS
jgi:hypothetical protein